jgi:hypothetical protein
MDIFFTVYGKNLSVFIGGNDVSTVYFVGDVVVVWRHPIVPDEFQKSRLGTIHFWKIFMTDIEM